MRARRAYALLGLALAIALAAAVLSASAASAQGFAVKWLPLQRSNGPLDNAVAKAPPACFKWRGLWRFVEVSEEFRERVVGVASQDPDVKSLLDEGYQVVDVRPVIKLVVSGDGTVTAKAPSAVLTLRKEDGGGRAFVWVDVEQGKVVKVVVCTVKVIEKA